MNIRLVSGGTLESRLLLPWVEVLDLIKQGLIRIEIAETYDGPGQKISWEAFKTKILAEQ